MNCIPDPISTTTTVHATLTDSTDPLGQALANPAPPTEPSTAHAVQRVVLEHALRLARSANMEVGVALALQCAWISGGSTSTPADVHVLLALPRPELALRLLAAVKQQDASQHRAWKALTKKAVALDAEYNSRVVSMQSPYSVSCWTFATGQLADQILGRCVDSDAYWQLVADTAKDIQDCYLLHLS